MKNYLQRRNNEDYGLNFFDDVFNDFFKPSFITRADSMKTDIKENEKNYELDIDMPGFDKKDIKLSLKDGYITVEAKKEQHENDGKSYIRRERSYSCARSYFVGDNLSEEDIK